jgi:8-oxo-dGTP pyrophosphatase MutT (NUDIX family)
MITYSETLTVIDRQNPETNQLELLVGAQQRGQWCDYFNFTGGKRNKGETDIEAAIRELTEETGLVIADEHLTLLGMIKIFNLRRSPVSFGTVAVYGAHLATDQPIQSDPEEIECLWVNPKDRNILLNMPHDVRYWLPTIYHTPRLPFTHIKTIQPDGAIQHETYLHAQDRAPIAVDSYQFNL